MVTEPQPSVLLLHADPGVQSRIRIACRDLNLSVTPSREEATARLAQGNIPSLMIADAAMAKRLLKDLERYAPKTIRVLLCDLNDGRAVRSLIDFAAAGHAFHTLNVELPPHELYHHLSSLLHTRLAGRIAPAPNQELWAHFILDGAQYRARVLDVASQGLGLAIDTRSSVQRLIPGRAIERLRVRADSRILLKAQRASIRHIQVSHLDGGTQYRLGIGIPALETAPLRSPREQTQDSVKDGVKILAILRRSLRRGASFRLQPVDGSRAQIAVDALDVAAVGRRSTLGLAVPTDLDAARGDVFDLQFDFAGQGYRGLVSVLRELPGELHVSAPQVLRQHHRRYSPRFTPITPVVVRFTSPLTGKPVVRRVVDLHGRGLSFVSDEAREPLPPGLMLEDMVLQFWDGQAMEVSASVRGCRPLTGMHGVSMHGLERPSQCGVRLLNVSESLREAILRVSFDGTEAGFADAGEIPFRNVWELLSEAKRSFPDHPTEVTGPHVDALDAVQGAMRRSRGSLGKSFVYREGGRVVGHAAGLRLYSGTWMLQHLVVRPTFDCEDHVSQKLSSLVFEYGEALEDIHYLRYAWFVATRWTHRLSTIVAKRLETPGLTELRFVHYARLARLESFVPTVQKAILVRRASSTDLEVLEQWLKDRGDVVPLLGDDLTAAEVLMPTLSSRFAQHRLERGRAVFVAEARDGTPLGFGLAEYATAGMCWPELTNSFRIVLPRAATGDDSDGAMRALVAQGVGFYRDRGRSSMLALPEPTQVDHFTASGFADLGLACEWTCHSSLARSWQALATALFERVERRKRPLGLRDENAA